MLLLLDKTNVLSIQYKHTREKKLSLRTVLVHNHGLYKYESSLVATIVYNISQFQILQDVVGINVCVICIYLINMKFIQLSVHERYCMDSF